MKQKNLDAGASLLLGVPDVLFIVTLLLVPVIWLEESLRFRVGPLQYSAEWNWKAVLPPFLFLGVRCLVRAALKRRAPGAGGILGRSLVRKILFAYASVSVFFLAFEGILAAAGYKAEMHPIVIRGERAETQPETQAVVHDRELLWRLNPGAPFRGRRVNNLGFLDRDVDPVKKPGTIRVICMGDSCTGQGPPPYSGHLHSMLTNAPPGGAVWEAFNTGVHGYSVAQGFRLWQNTVRDLAPDIVTIYYGWNDHWLASEHDIDRMAVTVGPVAGAILSRLQRKRFFQFLSSFRRPARSESGPLKGKVYRVPADDYRTLLSRMVTEIRAAGAIPILLTAPRRNWITHEVLRNGQCYDRDEAIRMHDLYADITREVARNNDAKLLDLAEIFKSKENRRKMSRDGIHFHHSGLEQIGKEIYKLLQETVAANEIP